MSPFVSLTPPPNRIPTLSNCHFFAARLWWEKEKIWDVKCLAWEKGLKWHFWVIYLWWWMFSSSSQKSPFCSLIPDCLQPLPRCFPSRGRPAWAQSFHLLLTGVSQAPGIGQQSVSCITSPADYGGEPVPYKVFLQPCSYSVVSPRSSRAISQYPANPFYR